MADRLHERTQGFPEVIRHQGLAIGIGMHPIGLVQVRVTSHAFEKEGDQYGPGGGCHFRENGFEPRPILRPKVGGGPHSSQHQKRIGLPLADGIEYRLQVLAGLFRIDRSQHVVGPQGEQEDVRRAAHNPIHPPPPSGRGFTAQASVDNRPPGTEGLRLRFQESRIGLPAVEAVSCGQAVAEADEGEWSRRGLCLVSMQAGETKEKQPQDSSLPVFEHCRGLHFSMLPPVSQPASVPQIPILEVDGVAKSYLSGRRRLQVLRDCQLRIWPGECVAILGPSGSGKTTLLGLCAGLDQPDAGSVRVQGVELGLLGEDGRAALRSRLVGFVFQNFQLLPSLTALENVMVPLELLGRDRAAESRARQLLGEVGLGDRCGHYPVQLSGGEQQRVALARAFANDPSLLFADEPTGNLDQGTREHVVDLLFQLNQSRQTTLVLVTHDLALAERCQRILQIDHGHVREISR